jgi:hypothetical protein
VNYDEQFILSIGVTTDDQIATSDCNLSLMMISIAENFPRFGSKHDVKKIIVADGHVAQW